MKLSCPYFLFTTSLLLVSTLILPSSCFSLHPKSLTSPPEPEELAFQEKTRLGSTPPSCHNKCNQCHPCMAVQVPTMPSHNRVHTSSSAESLTTPMDYFDPSHSYSGGNRYSNYKPLGWKCHCDNHFYNP